MAWKLFGRSQEKAGGQHVPQVEAYRPPQKEKTITKSEALRSQLAQQMSALIESHANQFPAGDDFTERSQLDRSRAMTSQLAWQEVDYLRRFGSEPDYIDTMTTKMHRIIARANEKADSDRQTLAANQQLSSQERNELQLHITAMYERATLFEQLATQAERYRGPLEQAQREDNAAQVVERANAPKVEMWSQRLARNLEALAAALPEGDPVREYLRQAIATLPGLTGTGLAELRDNLIGIRDQIQAEMISQQIYIQDLKPGQNTPNGYTYEAYVDSIRRKQSRLAILGQAITLSNTELAPLTRALKVVS
jgi:hypothetical protein